MGSRTNNLFAQSGETRDMNTKKLVPALVLSAAAMVPAVSQAELAANIGWVSEYLYRGIFQAERGSRAILGVNAWSWFCYSLAQSVLHRDAEARHSNHRDQRSGFGTAEVNARYSDGF